MTDEKKNDASVNEEKSCCASKSCCGCRKGRCILVALFVAAAAVGLFQAGKCSARHCMTHPAPAEAAQK